MPKDRPSMSDVQTRLHESFAEAMLEASKTECVICLDAGEYEASDARANSADMPSLQPSLQV